MTTVITSHPSKLKEKRTHDGVNTGQPVLHNRWAMDTIAHSFVQLVEDDVVDSATFESVSANANVARVGDVIQFLDGPCIGVLVTVAEKPDEDIMKLGQDLTVLPLAGDTFNILRYRPCVISDQGGIQVSVVSNPAQQISSVQLEETVSVTSVSAVILPGNVARIGGWVRNIDDVDVYVSFSSTATIVKPTKLRPGGSLSFGGDQYVYTGPVSAIHNDGVNSRTVEIVEL